MGLKAIFLALALSSAHATGHLMKRWTTKATFPPDSQCSEEQRGQILAEMVSAYNMVRTAKELPTHGDYYNKFFSLDLLSDKEWMASLPARYDRMADMLLGKDYALKLTCFNHKTVCQQWEGIAYMVDQTQTMNFCPAFFTDKPHGKNEYEGQWTHNLLAPAKCKKMTLVDAGQSKAANIVHELTHSDYAMLGQGRTNDFAYGIDDSMTLARGDFYRNRAKYAAKSTKTKPLCPDPRHPGREGLCPSKLSGRNADSYAYTAAGIWFSVQCRRKIPIPWTAQPWGPPGAF